MPEKNRILVSFLDGPKVEVIGDAPGDYHVQFIDADTGLVVYQTTIKPGHWAKANPKYLVNWLILVRHGDDTAQYRADYRGKKIYVDFASKALGDNIAWMPYVEELRERYGAEVTVKTFYNDLFRKSYDRLEFIEPGSPLAWSSYYAAFTLGAFDGDYNRNRNHWRLTPLQQIASDMLGMEFRELRARVDRSEGPRPIPGKYVAISEYSTFHAKHWLYPGGWQAIVDWLIGQGYAVMSVSKEPTKLKQVVKMNGRPIQETARNIQHADLFVGVSSGLSVMAWALEVPVVLISGFSMPDREMKVGVERVINRGACHGCGNDISHPYDRGNWNLCPRGRKFECSTSITPQMVKEAVSRALRPVGGAKVLLFTPHCSTGGGPQYLLKAAEELLKSGHEVVVVEHDNLSDHYVVQKRKLRNLCRFHTLNGNKASSMRELMEAERPDIVHVQEFAERWMDAGIAEELYRKDRGYRIVETTHSSERVDKRHLPDAFAFVSPLHFKQYGDLGVPSYSADYPIERRERPPREQALRKLGLDPGKRHILHVGLFAPWKNQAEMFELARLLPQHQFHFVGNQAINFKGYWEPLMMDKPDNCIVWGERADVDDFYAAMDLFYFPSTTECNPIVLKEAMSWRMPVLMRDLPAYCGIYEGKPGINFIQGNISDIRREVVDILADDKIGLSDIYADLGNCQTKN